MPSVVFELKTSARAFCRMHRIGIGEQRLQRIVARVVRRMEREADRLERVEIETSDGRSLIDYRDPTGESAVFNVMREMSASG